MKYTIISTYPENGSKNIGDALISQATINAIRLIKGKDCTFQVVWRAENWEDVKEKILDSDAVIFACFAIRKNINNKIYPFLQKLLESEIPLGIIAAGTSLNMHNLKNNIFTGFTVNDLDYLNKLNQKTLFFTTRGYLSQSFCKFHGNDNVTHSGDIAFFDPRFTRRKFELKKELKKIAISDPHNSHLYLDSVIALIKGLKNMFPKAELVLMLHGLNPIIENYCNRINLKYEKIYLDKDNGLDIYDTVDLHVGFRVHAHVSALNRRIPSYLLEQDGRGCDYGLTIEKKISVSSFSLNKSIHCSIRNVIRLILGKKLGGGLFVPINPVHQILSMIVEDANAEFIKFKGLDKQILQFNEMCLSALKKLP